MDELYIHLEDVFITGVVAEKVEVERRNNEQFKNNAVRVPARFMGQASGAMACLMMVGAFVGFGAIGFALEVGHAYALYAAVERDFRRQKRACKLP